MDEGFATISGVKKGGGEKMVLGQRPKFGFKKDEIVENPASEGLNAE